MISPEFPELYGYQRETVDFIIRNNRCAVLSGTGTGKTRCLIEAILELKLNKVLWITKASLRLQTVNEWDKWCRDKPCKIIGVEDVASFGVHVVSYQFCQKKENVDALKSAEYKMVVMDESSFITNWDSITTMNILYHLVPHIMRAVFVTATPYRKCALELHPMLASIQPGKWGASQEFASFYCNKKTDNFNRIGWKWDGVKQGNAAVLKDALKTVGIRYTLKDVSNELPGFVKQEIILDGGAGNKTMFGSNDVINGRDGVMQEQIKVGKFKVDLVLDWLEDSENVPTILFCWFKECVELYAKKLADKGFRVGVITGDVSFQKRDEIVKQFQQGSLDYMVATISSCGEGLNIDKAERVLFAESTWTNSPMDQAYARAVRLTTEHVVQVIYFWLDNSLDTVIKNILNGRKIQTKSLELHTHG